MWVEVDRLEFRVRDFAFGGVVPSDQSASNLEPRLGGRRTDQLDDGLVAVQRLTGPMLADLTEEPVLNRIPFGGAGRKVAERERRAGSKR